MLPTVPGIYAFIALCDRAAWVELGSLGRRRVDAGFYTYVGSAHGPGGIRARLGRHLAGTGRRHWHIDFLRPRLRPTGVWFAATDREQEHVWAEALSRGRGLSVPFSGFGASDCACLSHLFWSAHRPCLGSFKRRLCRRLGADLAASVVASSSWALSPGE